MRKLFSWLWRVLWKTALWFLGISVFSVVLFRFLPVPFTPLMLIRCVEQKADGQEFILKKDWQPLEKISPHLQLAVVCSEDQNFLQHNGFDFEAIDKALQHNEKSKRKRGASTISQQTAKNLFLWPGRSWIRKGFEVYFTALIELLWNKERIMEVYLNIIEMGNGIYGAEAASKQFFKKSALSISKPEAALIAAVLPNPRKWSPAKPTAYLLKRQGFVLKQMALWGGVLKYEQTEKKSEKASRKKKK